MAAVQARYQKHIVSEKESFAIVQDFHSTFFLQDHEVYKDINVSFFEKLVSCFDDEIDFPAIVDKILSREKSLSNSSIMTQCIIEVAIIEDILGQTDRKIIINEYIDIAKEFVNSQDIRFVNAVLDKVLGNNCA
jgi:transcription termination factor NusB